MSLLSEKMLKELVADDFVSRSRMMQIKGFLTCLCKAGHTKISPQEITQLFKDANMRSPETSKKIRCGAFKVREYLDAISKEPSQSPTMSVKQVDDDLYSLNNG